MYPRIDQRCWNVLILLVGASVGIYWWAVFAATSRDPLMAQVRLGQRLFIETRLDAEGRLSCASCHQPERAFTDGLAIAPGTLLNTPGLHGIGARRTFTWSGAVSTLEAAVLRPLANPAEQGPLRDETLARLADLRADYEAAFPHTTPLITWEQTVTALSAYLRTLEPPRGAYHRFMAGDETALPPAALRGLRLFRELGCGTCHREPLLFTESKHNLGLDPLDPQRYRVPSLIGVANTAPYFHDGSAATLEEVLDVYQQGGRENGRTNPAKSSMISPFLLTEQERADLLALLEHF
jgi:cytochrome c peroxidase